MSTELTKSKILTKYADFHDKVELWQGIATGAAAIDHILTPGAAFKLKKVELHLSAAPTTSENFAVALDANAGAVYDVVILKQDLSVGSVVDLIWLADNDDDFGVSDVLAITWTNTNTKTWGLTITYEKI